MLFGNVLSVLMGFPGGSADREPTCNAGDLGSIPGLGRSPGEGKGCPLEYLGLENSTDSVAHGVAKSRMRLSDFVSFSQCINILLLETKCLEQVSHPTQMFTSLFITRLTEMSKCAVY